MNKKLKASQAESYPPTWEELVDRINNTLGGGYDLRTPPKGVSNQELFTAISFAHEKKMGIESHSIIDLHHAVCEEIKKCSLPWNDNIKALASKLMEWGLPVITTNYDQQLEKSLKLNRYRLNHLSPCTSYYPANLYYSYKRIHPKDVNSHFAIWHCSGLVEIERSLRLDLSDYCNYVAWLKKSVPAASDSRYNAEVFDNTWLFPFFANKLIIIGLGLESAEIYLRWLLVRRYAWRIEQQIDWGHHGYYVCVKESPLDKGQELFLESVGLKILKYDTWAQMYNELFDL